MNKARSPSFLSQCARLLGITDDEYFLCIRSGDVGNGRVAAGGLYQKTSTRGQVRRDGDMNIGLGLVDVDDVTGAKANVLVLDEVQIAYHLNGPLDEREFKAYSSTKLKDERLAVYTFTILLTNFDNLTLGVGVHFRQSDEVWIGTLRWKSYLPEQREWYTVQYEKLTVGIELSPEYAGKGNSDGEFEGKRYFSCEKDRAIFVPFYSAKVARQGGKVKSTMTSPAIETDSTSYITSDRDVMNVLNNAYRQPVTTTSISHGSDRKQKVHNEAVASFEITSGRRARTGPFKITVPKEIVAKYGMAKFQENIENTKRIAGVFSCHYEPDLEWCMVEALDDLCETVYQNLELIQTNLRLQPERRNLFRKSELLKGVMDISRCSVHLDEKTDSLVLIGLLSEVNAAKLLLDEHTAVTKVTQSGKKPKPKNKKNRNKNVAPTPYDASVTCSPPASTEFTANDKVRTSQEDARTSNVLSKTERFEALNSVRTDAVAVTSSAATATSSASNVSEYVVGDQEPELENSDESQGCQQVPATEEEPVIDCVVCMSERPTVAFVPCGHRHTCQACAKKVFESANGCCPSCREKIKSCIRIWT